MKITLKQLNIFILTHKLGSISDAASASFITQSAASMSLSELEKMLNFPLFDRAGKRLLINSNGRALLPKAIDIVDRAMELESFSKAGIDNVSGTITIGASTTIGNYVLPHFLARFQQKYPYVKIEFSISNTEEIIEGLSHFDFDVGIVEGDEKADNLCRRVWLSDELVVIANSKHDLARKKRVSFKDLERYKWVTREEGSGTGALFRGYIKGKCEINSALCLTNPEAIKSYVRSSDCLSCVSKAILSPKTDKGLKIIDVSGFKLVRPFYLVSNERKFKSTAVTLFEECLMCRSRCQSKAN